MPARLLAIVTLVLLNGFFVGAEFALVRSRRTRLEAMARGGDRLAALALRATSNIPALLSASQLGVTLASLGLGYAAQSVLTVPVAADILWMLNHPDTWLLLVVRRRWTPQRYERWLATTSCEQLLDMVPRGDAD